MTVDDPEPLLRRAREAAFENARAKATQLAELAGRAVGRVVAVSDAPSAGGVPTAFAAKRFESAAADLPVAPGESTLTASVAVRFAWAD